jgi:hypothetical protein
MMVRLVPNLSLAALKANLDKELAVWYCLRAINYWGSGNLDLRAAVDALTSRFHYSRSSVYRLLASGDDILWSRRTLAGPARSQIRICGIRQVATRLNVRCSGHFVQITADQFVGSGKNRVRQQRAWLYATFYKPTGIEARPISRAAIHEATGVSRRSQQRYDKIAVESVPNYADRQDETGKMTPVLILVDGKNRQWIVHRQLGNTYHCQGKIDARGMLRKINNLVRQSLLGEEPH